MQRNTGTVQQLCVQVLMIADALEDAGNVSEKEGNVAVLMSTTSLC